MSAGWRCVLALSLALGAGIAGASSQPAPTSAQLSPADRAREAAAMLTAAGFRIQGDQILNSCGRPARPRPNAVDLDGDGRAEAIVTDVDAACYGGTGEAFWVIQKLAPFSWTRVGAGQGRVRLLDTRTNGWRDLTLVGPACTKAWGYQPRQGYTPLRACPAPAAAAAVPATPAGGAGDTAAAFKAAGFTPSRGKYLACDKSQELQIEFRDLNGDGRPDAIITDSGLECFGNTGQGWTLVTKEASGAWRKLYESPGIPDFLPSKGAGGWPDVVNGGPGFCFPVLRWNGSDYAIARWKAEQPGACAGRK